MTCIYSKNLGLNTPNYPAGGSYCRVVIVSDETPASLTIDGSDVDGLSDADVIAVGSVLITPDKNYIAFEDGVFTEKGAA